MLQPAAGRARLMVAANVVLPRTSSPSVSTKKASVGHTEYFDQPESHDYQINLALNGIEQTKTNLGAQGAGPCSGNGRRDREARDLRHVCQPWR